MLFWVLLAAITLVVAAALARPLLRGPKAPLAARAAYDRAIYLDQLAEVERDRQRGVIGTAEAEAARHEVERRLLSTARGETAAAAPAASGPARGWRAAAVALVVPLVGLGMYAWLGSPGDPSQPAAATDMADTAGAGANGAPHDSGDASLESAAAQLEKRLAQNPRDADGWLLLARTRAVLRQWRGSEIAFQKAIDLTGGAPDALAGYGEMIVMSEDGTVSPTARTFFHRALLKDPNNVVGRFYLGLAEVQDGKPAEAVAAWRKLAASAPKDATWLAPLRAQIAAAAKQAGIPAAPEELAAAQAANAPPAAQPQPEAPPAAAAMPGPTQEQMQAAQSMSPEDRQNMIRGMVQQLADRLKANPNDPEGWQRLARAYQVLGEPDKAKEALSHVKGAAAAPPAGPNADATQASPPAAMPGPTQEQMQAAQSMSPEDRQNMIRGMVARLADKMKANPKDADGWMRLGRAYTVLGEHDKAADALDHAVKLRPNDTAPLVGEAEALLATVPMDGSKPLPDKFLTVAKKLESMSADSPDALWYIGLAAKQEKRTQVARASWTTLLGKLDPASQEAQMVKGALDKLGK